MKKLMTLMLGLAFALTTVAVAQEGTEKKDAPKVEKKKKASKKKVEEKKAPEEKK